jgi:hypothetical protein
MLIQLRAKLLTYDSITSVVGTNIFPYHIPQTATLPAISMNLISQVNDHTLALGRANLSRIRVQIDCWSVDYIVADNLATNCEVALDGFQGDMSGLVVGQTTLDERTEMWEEVEGDDQGTYHIASDFIFLVYFS